MKDEYREGEHMKLHLIHNEILLYESNVGILLESKTY